MRWEVLPCSEETKNKEEETSLFGVHRVIPNICTDPLIKTMHLKCIISVSLVCALHLCVYACDLYLCVCYSPVYLRILVLTSTLLQGKGRCFRLKKPRPLLLKVAQLGACQLASQRNKFKPPKAKLL